MLPKLISFGSFYLPTYGVLVAIAFLVALWITIRLGKSAGLSSEQVTNLATYCAIAGLIGAKLFMIAFDWQEQEYGNHLGSIFSVNNLQAAGVYQGGLLLAILTAILYMRRQHMPILRTCDVFAPGLAAGHAIGRIGCLAAGCCWGEVCHLPWAITFTNNEATTGVPLGQPLHPTQLYESFGNAAIFALLYWRFRKPHRDGSIFGEYLVLYSILRFVVEFFRAHQQPLQFGLSLTQWISLGTLIAGIWLLISKRTTALAPHVGTY
jgi:phosphatidylglycerol---prolipoprotein diacylglyceryl transferase